MAPREHDGNFQGSYFALEIDGLTLGFFTGCTGLSLEFEPITHKMTDGGMMVEKKIPGKPKYTEVVLKRGFTPDQELYTWFKEVVDAAVDTPYKTASIVIFSRIQTEVARFNLEQCWPSKLSVSDLKADGNEVMVEELTIQHEYLSWA